MRIIAGHARGMKLLSPPAGCETRPITDRAKEALFSILEPYVRGCRFLDLFSGTGAVGIEALSRGAAEAVFVELDPSMVSTLRRNLQRTGLATSARVHQGDVFEFLRRKPSPYDIIYVAPPQYRRLWADTLELLDQRPGWESGDGLVVVQFHPVETAELELRRLRLFDRRDYGRVTLSFYGWGGAASS